MKWAEFYKCSKAQTSDQGNPKTQGETIHTEIIHFGNIVQYLRYTQKVYEPET